MRNSFQIWVNAVCEQVRFRPDHRRIEFELRDHYEDHVRDLLRLGRPRELAEERALAAMGNAQEVGRALDKVHKPWLGWLWEASRALALVLAVLAAVTLFWTAGLNSLAERTIDELTWEEPPVSAAKVELEHAPL
ncbi:MAG: permease prefix domain 1-containing protein, partial [Dysosmobacter sp.]|nr:permease prefix domain 1-containing protein [Dysosmobacter sp.]